jgi:hypothetical protein
MKLCADLSYLDQELEEEKRKKQHKPKFENKTNDNSKYETYQNNQQKINGINTSRITQEERDRQFRTEVCLV